jgi:xanthosine phosphorylase
MKNTESPAHVAAAVISERVPDFRPKIGLILGSGLGPLVDSLEDPIVIPYDELPGFRPSTVVGHKGSLALGHYKGVPIVCMTGRPHFYEGAEATHVATPIRTMRLCGVEILLATNASGSLREDFPPGSVVLLSDHINMMGINPLTGPNDDNLGPRFVPMYDAYDLDLRKQMKAAAREVGTEITEGIYLALSGPTFETKAEVKALRTLGGDIVGMSTVPEVIVARHCGLRVAALSVVTNYAATGDHDLTLATSAETLPKVKPLVERWFELVGDGANVAIGA